MPKHQEVRTLPFSPDQLFALVADIEQYPVFLPWCRGARILERRGDIVTADLIIGYRMVREKFTSVVTLDRPRKISVKYMSGPLSHLRNEWEFRPAAKGACDLYFHVDFDFRSTLMRAAMEMLFDKALSKMAGAFEARARALYGK